MSKTGGAKGRLDALVGPAQKGAELAGEMMPVLYQHMLHYAKTDREKVEWWAGFMADIAGYMGAAIGRDAAKVIGDTISRMVLDEARKHEH